MLKTRLQQRRFQSSVAMPKLPTTRESLARISESLSRIANMIETALFDGKGDPLLEGLSCALMDIAEYGPGKAPKGSVFAATRRNSREIERSHSTLARDGILPL